MNAAALAQRPINLCNAPTMAPGEGVLCFTRPLEEGELDDLSEAYGLKIKSAQAMGDMQVYRFTFEAEDLEQTSARLRTLQAELAENPRFADRFESAEPVMTRRQR